MDPREIKIQLRSLRHHHGQIEPDRAWVARNRGVLLSQIKNTVNAARVAPSLHDRVFTQAKQAAKLFLPQNIVGLVRSVGFVSLALLLTVSGWIASVSAAQNSLPGDTLYNVKLATEKTELIVATVVGGQKDKVNTLLKHASNRVEEYHKSKTTDQAKVAIQSLKQSIESTSQSLDAIGVSQPDEATTVAKTVNEKTEILLNSLDTKPATELPQTVENSIEGVGAADLQKEIGEATHLIEVTGVKAVQVLVENTLAGDQSIYPQEIKATVEKKLDDIVTGFSKINEDAAAVTTAIDPTIPATPTTMSSETIPLAPLTASSVASDTSQVLDQTLFVLSAPTSTTPTPVTIAETIKATGKRSLTNKILEKQWQRQKFD